MDKKNYIWPRLSGLFFSVLIILIPMTASAIPPDWLQNHFQGNLTLSGAYHGVSFAEFEGKTPDYDAIRLAKDRALDDLCYKLAVSVKSQFEEKIAQTGDHSEENVSSSLFVGTRQTLSGVEEKDKWANSRKKRYWVLLVIDKAKADEQVGSQKFINEVVDRLTHKQDEILKGVEKISSVLSQTMKGYEDKIEQIGGLLTTIDSKIEAAGKQTKNEYSLILQEIKKLQDTKQQSQQIQELINQNKMLQNMLVLVTGRIQKDYFLTLANDDLKNKAVNPNFSVNIEPDKGQGADYYYRENIRFLVRASNGCYIKVIYLSSTEEGSGSEKRINTLLFPNVHDKDNWIKAGETKEIGRLGELEVSPPFGKDIITIVASSTQFKDIEEALRQAEGGYYSEVTSSTNGALQMRNRGITVTQSVSSSVSGDLPPDPIATDTCFIVSHPN